MVLNHQIGVRFPVPLPSLLHPAGPDIAANGVTPSARTVGIREAFSRSALPHPRMLDKAYGTGHSSATASGSGHVRWRLTASGDSSLAAPGRVPDLGTTACSYLE